MKLIVDKWHIERTPAIAVTITSALKGELFIHTPKKAPPKQATQ